MGPTLHPKKTQAKQLQTRTFQFTFGHDSQIDVHIKIENDNETRPKYYLVDEVQDFRQNMRAFSGIHRCLIEQSRLLQNGRLFNVLKRIAASYFNEIK